MALVKPPIFLDQRHLAKRLFFHSEGPWPFVPKRNWPGTSSCELVSDIVGATCPVPEQFSGDGFLNQTTLHFFKAKARILCPRPTEYTQNWMGTENDQCVSVFPAQGLLFASRVSAQSPPSSPNLLLVVTSHW